MSTLRLSAKHLRGFTLVELVVTLLIIGVLAAIAVPKFVGLGGQARQAAFLKIRGDAISTFQTVWALSLVSGQTGATGTVSIGGQTVNLKYGYPTKGSVNKVFTLPNKGQGDFAWMNSDASGWNLSGYDAVVDATYQGSAIQACWFGYQEATATSPAVISSINSIASCANPTLVTDMGVYTTD